MVINFDGGIHSIDSDAKIVGFRPFDFRLHEKEIAYVQAAIGLIAAISINVEICVKCFQDLPKKRSLSDILHDPAVYINYLGIVDTRIFPNGKNLLGGTIGNDIAITMKAFEKAFETNDSRYIAAVLLHEMAHVNGAPMNNMQAEDILIPCGFKMFHDKDAHPPH